MSSGLPFGGLLAPADLRSPADAQATCWEALSWEALTAEALIAEARARARRRRRRVALVVIAAAVVAAAGVLITHSAWSTSHATRTHPHVVPLTARTGVVTGHLEACSGLPIGAGPFANDAPPVTPGTVTVLRGKESWKPVGPGESWLELPATVVAREYISNNYHQTFRFVLPARQYVLVGRYTHSNVSIPWPMTVAVGKVLRQDVPNLCS